jgi:hypothetical protein
MDFMRLLKSLEELLYEVMVMLVFFPRTLWLTFRYPQRMMDYADTELGDVQSEQYKDTLSPPLFLMVCLLISHLVERATPANVAVQLPAFLEDTQNLLIFRVFIFSIFPLIMSLRLLQRMKIDLDRDTLKPIFYSQCFVTAPVTIFVGVGTAVSHAGGSIAHWAANLIFAIGFGWYISQQTLWFKTKLDTGMVRAAANAIGATLAAIIVIILTGIAVLLSTMEV